MAKGPRYVVRGEQRYRARTEAMRTLLHRMGHPPDGLRSEPDPDVVRVWNA